MKQLAYRFVGTRPRRRLFGTAAIIALCAAGFLVTLVGGALAAASAVPLGTADSFGILAGSGITNTGATTVNGDIGTFPTTIGGGDGS